MATTNFGKTPLEKKIEALFPNVSGFEIELLSNAESVRYEKYSDRHRKREVYEHPPVARWFVNGKHFIYVLKPEFNTKNMGNLLIGEWKETNPIYDDEEHVLFHVINMSCKGFDVERINKEIEGMHIHRKVTGSSGGYLNA